ncbi:MAG TPA: alpha/beta hydrolase, partial [Acidimicrobiales bacterium]|nr:alpha/beta hydrolase [Acidimicrobiales bacterium]
TDRGDLSVLPYDEFSMFADNAAEAGLPYHGPPTVTRRAVEVAPGRSLSALVWGEAVPEAVLVHGSAQNAHTFDTTALALQRPLIALDLPGHGHSDGPDPAGGTAVTALAADVAVAVRALAPTARVVVGMSLGGLTALALAATAPALVPALVLVDITPGVTSEKARAITEFVQGPATFPSFDELLARTMAFNPTRSEASLRRGILHNAVQLDDGSWMWRYRRHAVPEHSTPPDRAWLWEALAGFAGPVLLVRGTRAGSVVDDDDEARFLATARHGTVARVDAGHSVQGDQPVELARLIAGVLGG